MHEQVATSRAGRSRTSSKPLLFLTFSVSWVFANETITSEGAPLKLRLVGYSNSSTRNWTRTGTHPSVPRSVELSCPTLCGFQRVGTSNACAMRLRQQSAGGALLEKLAGGPSFACRYSPQLRVPHPLRFSKGGNLKCLRDEMCSVQHFLFKSS